MGATMWDDIKRLHEFHGELPLEVRLLKLTEEVGEAAEALIGARGLNPRKGVCRTQADLLDELCDVIITAAIAMSAITDGGADQARVHLEQRLAVVTARAGL
ncbi:MAG TPA: MazG-like family protein [Streptosporangiaceae bacterium]|nr:MazG-like family protein [Streptosporangiaceae bacterium]